MIKFFRIEYPNVLLMNKVPESVLNKIGDY